MQRTLSGQMKDQREGREGVLSRMEEHDGVEYLHNALFGTWGWADEANAVSRARPRQEVLVAG